MPLKLFEYSQRWTLQTDMCILTLDIRQNGFQLCYIIAKFNYAKIQLFIVLIFPQPFTFCWIVASECTNWPMASIQKLTNLFSVLPISFIKFNHQQKNPVLWRWCAQRACHFKVMMWEYTIGPQNSCYFYANTTDTYLSGIWQYAK